MIETIYRIRCDEITCRGWLSLPQDYVPGTDLLPGSLVVRPTAERAALYEESRRAQMSAVGYGWRPLDPDMLLWICPRCIDRARAHKREACQVTGCGPEFCPGGAMCRGKNRGAGV